jgi:hypothetical protein
MMALGADLFCSIQVELGNEILIAVDAKMSSAKHAKACLVTGLPVALGRSTFHMVMVVAHSLTFPLPG